MQMRTLGNSGLVVSELCFGVMTFGDRGQTTGGGNWSDLGVVNLHDAKEMVTMAVEAGINFFDVADAYKSGQAEEMLGQALGPKRNDVVIATKVRFGSGGTEPNDTGLSRRQIVTAVEGSLRRLGTDWIDLYQIHSMDPATPLEETLHALDDIVRKGYVRYIGASNLAGWQLMKALAISDRAGLARFVSLQPYYSLAARELEWERVPLALDQGLAILPWSPLSGGYLSGKYRQTGSAGRRLLEMGRGFAPVDEARGEHILNAAEEVAQARGVSMAQVALNWVRTQPGVTSTIIGATNRDQLADNLRSVIWNLTPEEHQRLNMVSALPKPYPYWHLELTGSDRTRYLPATAARQEG